MPPLCTTFTLIVTPCTQIRRRAIEAPLGPKIGYHEIDDEKEEADEDWMLGEASQLSGAGTRGSSNWVLKVMVPILVSETFLCSGLALLLKHTSKFMYFLQVGAQDRVFLPVFYFFCVP